MKKPIVVKIGGSILGNHDTTLDDLVALQKRGIISVVVHGGGNLVTEWLERQGVPTKFEKGLRVTDERSLEVVVAVLAGLVNKEIVAAINSRGGRAMGLSGIDGCLFEGEVLDPEIGYHGEITKVNLEPLKIIVDAGYIPVVAPPGIQSTPGEGQMLININGDNAAGEVAAALGADRLIFLTDVEGVCDSQGELLPKLAAAEARALIASGVISGGMTIKVEACLQALGRVSSAHIVDGRIPHALLAAVEGQAAGTRIE